MKSYLTIAILMFVCAVSAFAQDKDHSAQTRMTSRQYYQEIKDADGVPTWAVNVCFEKHLFLNGEDLEDIGVFMLMGESEHTFVRTQEYINGVGAHILYYRKETESTLIFHGLLDKKPITSTFMLNWNTGRFSSSLGSRPPEVSEGICESVSQ